MYENQSYYCLTLSDPTLLSASQGIFPVVHDRVVDCLTDRYQKAWRLGWLHHQKSSDWSRLGAYATIVGDDQQQGLLDTSDSKIGLHKEGLAGLHT